MNAALPKRPPNHGVRISGAEYDRRVAELVQRCPEEASGRWQRARRHHEIDAAIDHRLGVDFPQDRRLAWKRVADATDRWSLPLMVSILMGATVFMQWAYRSVISREEFDAFFLAP